MSSTKDMLKALETRLEAIEAKLAALTVSDAKGKRKAKSASESEEKPKREFKPSAARDAWRALCDAVRAVHKKDAMKIAKILKADGHMTPTAKQIEEAIARFEKDGPLLPASASASASVSETEASATSASEAEEEKKPQVPKKAPAKARAKAT
jgi:hypothetical protein